MTGKQSLLFDKDVYVRCTATVVGKKEADGPLGEMFDVAVEDDMFGKKSWEEAESHIQEMAVEKRHGCVRHRLYLCRRPSWTAYSNIFRSYEI